MCGRFTLHSTPDQIVDVFNVSNAINFPATYNAAPSQDLPIIIKDRIGLAHWGFLAPWDEDLSKARKPINARIETVAQSKMFASAFEKRRCVVPANGFYEWLKTSEGKSPYYFYPENEAIMAFAGIWSQKEIDGENRVSFSILTQEAGEDVAPIHKRQPVMLPVDQCTAYMEADTDTALRIAQDNTLSLKKHVVTKQVNNPTNDDASLVEDMLSTTQQQG